MPHEPELEQVFALLDELQTSLGGILIGLNLIGYNLTAGHIEKNIDRISEIRTQLTEYENNKRE